MFFFISIDESFHSDSVPGMLSGKSIKLNPAFIKKYITTLEYRECVLLHADWLLPHTKVII